VGVGVIILAIFVVAIWFGLGFELGRDLYRWGRSKLDARRRRITEECETWCDSVTKQTKQPPMTSVIEGVRAKEFAAASDPDLSTYIALAVPKTPSPTAPASAAKVRRATKRNRK
jgi:hypothetical protein